jgi:vacuolar-type H+-ATPase subunit F/Vma7
MNRTAARLVIVAPPELVSGFRLAGVSVVSAEDAAEAYVAIERLIADEKGVIAVYQPFFDVFEPELRERLERSVAPVVVSYPAGLSAAEPGERRARILGMLQQAVGYHVTFGRQEP